MIESIYDEPLYGSSESQLIRLIHLIPGRDTSPVSCLLYSVSLKTNPHYDAISYCWGGQEPSVPILCNGKLLAITPNLHDALCRFREPDEPVTLWADAICINQRDLREKNEQVPLMNRIYGQAHRVQVWLGPAAGDDALRAAHAVSSLVQAAHQYSQQAGVSLHTLEDLKSDRRIVTPNNMSQNVGLVAHWPALTQLLLRPWFSRAWVIQEVALAHRRSWLHCGDTRLWWPDVALAVFFSDRSDVLPMFLASCDDATSHALHRVAALARTTTNVNREGDQDGNDGLGMLWLLYTNLSAAATDPRDKVYALLSLARRKGSQDAPLFITPDYHLDVATVYQQVTEKFLAQFPKLAILSALALTETHSASASSNNNNQALSLPSWVIDWSQPVMGELQTPVSIDKLCEAGFSGEYNASRTDTWPKVYQVDGRILKLSGFIIDEVVESADLFSTQDFNTHHPELSMPLRSLLILKRLHKTAKLWGYRHNGVYGYSGEPSSLAFLKTLMLGKVSDQFDASTCNILIGNILRLAAVVSTMEESPIGRSNLSLTAGLSLLNRVPSSIARFSAEEEALATHIISSVTNKTIFRTRRGYMGVSWSRRVQAGDHVALVRGGCVPLVLRPNIGNSWQLIGDGYLHGLMAGEAFNPHACHEICLA